MVDDPFSDELKECYHRLRQDLERIHYDTIEAFDVVQSVNQYRLYWKPDLVKLILLAESHVYTCERDFQVFLTQKKMEGLGDDETKIDAYLHNMNHYARFVYCLGYGENDFLETPLDPLSARNVGTWQYWKLLASCESTEKSSYDRWLKKGTRNFSQRIKNKINLLQDLKDRGIWLLDASIMGLYIPKDDNDRKDEILGIVLDICWNAYINTVINKVNEKKKPPSIVIVGRTVEKMIGNKIQDILRLCIDQPQSHLTKEERQEQMDELNRVAQQYAPKGSQEKI